MFAICVNIANIITLRGWLLLPNVTIAFANVAMLVVAFSNRKSSSVEQQVIALEKELWEKEKVINQQEAIYQKNISLRH